MFKKIALSVIILVIVVLAGAYFYRNSLVAKAVESGSEYALGVKTELSSAALDIGGGSLTLNNFTVDNPEGFTGNEFMSMRRGMVEVKGGSVLKNEVVVDSLIIDGIALNLEQIDRKGNFQVLLDNIKRLEMSSSKETRKFRIGLIAVRDVQVNGSLSLSGNKREKSFTLDDFSLRNVGGDNGATVGQVTAIVVKALVSKALAAGSGLLPEGFGANLSDMKERGVEKVTSEATNKLKDLGKSLTGEKK
jgi:hypothetical protein